MKAIKTWLATITMLLCSLTASAHDFEVDGICYNITSFTDLTVSVTYEGYYYTSYSNEYSGAVTIPSTVTYNNKIYSVKSIGDHAFYECSSLITITIPESVVSVENYAFEKCTSLKEIIIEDGNETLLLGYNFASAYGGEGLFYNCPLESVYLGRNLNYNSEEVYGYSPFYRNSKLTNLTIGRSVTSIGSSAFRDCNSLTSITIPESVMSIGNCAFSGCSSLKEIIIEESDEILSLGYNYRYNTGSGTYNGLFYDCSLEYVYWGRNLSYEYSPFKGQTKLIVLTFSKNVTSIGNNALSGCTSLSSLTIPESVSSIGDSAFSGCSSLSSLTIPESVTSIGNSAFSGCSSLNSITIPEAVTSIGDSTFSGCSSLSSITIPEDVTSIGNLAFSNCGGLTSITIPKNVTFIGNYSFNNCVVLKEIIFEDGHSALSLGYNYHYSSGSGGSNSIGEGLFYDCPLDSVYLGRNLSYESGYNYGYSPFYKSGNFPTISLGNEVTTISPFLFYENTKLITIVIPASVTSVGNYAFGNCSALKTVIFEDGSETLSLGYNGSKQGLFNDCPLESVYLGRNLSYTSGYNYGYSPFYNKNALNCVTIAGGVTTIADYAFYGCDNIPSLTIHSGVLTIGNNAFSTPAKVIWLTNTPPIGYENAEGNINYVSNEQYTSLSNVKVYPYLSSMFEVDGVKYVPVSPSERTCHAIDCAYDSTAAVINVGKTASFKGVAMKVTEVMPYIFHGNGYIKEVLVSHLGGIGDYAFKDCNGLETAILANYIPTGISNNNVPLMFVDWTSTNKVHGSTSSNTYNITAKDGMVLSFDWWVSSESKYDKLVVTLDGTTILEKSGSLSGNYSNPVSQGEHVLIVKYTKDGSGSSGSDQAKISNITVGNGSNMHTIAIVGNEVFSGCSSLKTVILSDSIGSLGYKAFYQCLNLENIEISDSVKTIGDYCFSECGLLATINIPQATSSIGDYAFSGCSKLADVIIEDRTTALSLGSNGSSALFVDCPLDSVYIGGKITYNTTSNKGYSPFYRNTSLRSAVITDREEQIYANEFYGCTNLQNVTIGNGVKSIGNYAFSGCSSLAGFSFGSSMETIGDEAFSDCTNLTSITSHAAVPPTCGTQALDDINKWNCVLGVPLGNADAYYAADQWKEFFFIDDVVEVDHYVLTYVVDGEVVHTEVLKHKDAVTMLAEPTKVGYEFSGWDKTLTTMPAEDVIISGTFTRLPIENLIILDTETAFAVDEEMECEVVTYIRDFKDTEWQALYVPFEIPVTEEFLANFEVADLNNVHQYDRDDDGVIDETVIEAFKMTSGTLEANYPYLIRAKETGEKTITVTDAVLYATEENSIDCSSVRDKFTFTGTYSSLSSAELPQGEGYYTLIEGEWKPVTEAVSLGAFRFYLKVDSRSSALAAEARSIRMRIIGENGEDDATEIDYLGIRNHQSEIIYDLQGRRVENPTKGIYIVNGKRVVIK